MIEALTDAVHRVGNFWDRVSDGLEIQTLWSQFFSEARASYGLYSREVDWDALRHETRFQPVPENQSHTILGDAHQALARAPRVPADCPSGAGAVRAQHPARAASRARRHSSWRSPA